MPAILTATGGTFDVPDEWYPILDPDVYPKLAGVFNDAHLTQLVAWSPPALLHALERNTAQGKGFLADADIKQLHASTLGELELSLSLHLNPVQATHSSLDSSGPAQMIEALDRKSDLRRAHLENKRWTPDEIAGWLEVPSLKKDIIHCNPSALRMERILSNLSRLSPLPDTHDVALSLQKDFGEMWNIRSFGSSATGQYDAEVRWAKKFLIWDVKEKPFSQPQGASSHSNHGQSSGRRGQYGGRGAGSNNPRNGNHGNGGWGRGRGAGGDGPKPLPQGARPCRWCGGRHFDNLCPNKQAPVIQPNAGQGNGRGSGC